MIRSKRVTEIFKDCLLREKDLNNSGEKINPIFVEGMTGIIPFHPEKINYYKDEIKDMLRSLPSELRKDWGFLDLCMPVEEKLWTRIHEVCEQILLLGIAIGDTSCMMPCKNLKPLPQGGKIIKNPVSMISKDFSSREEIGMYKTWVVNGNLRIKFTPKIERIQMFFDTF